MTTRTKAPEFEGVLAELDKFLAQSQAGQTEADSTESAPVSKFGWAKDMRDAAATQYERVLVGRTDMLDAVLMAMAAEGHIIFRGNPGEGKTETAKVMGAITGLSWKRIQFTPTLMPEDITGAHYPDPTTGQWEFEEGPVFTNLLVADEINRANPKTVAGMLEASGEGSVTSRGVTYPLPKPFTIIMTINPIESEGVYPVPEAQLDRALALFDISKLRGRGQMAGVAARALGQPIVAEPVFNGEGDIKRLIQLRQQVRVSPELLLFIEDIVYRFDFFEDELDYDPAPRAARSLARMGQAVALLDGRGGATAADIRKFAVPVLQHRLQVKPGVAFNQGLTNADTVRQVLAQVPDPESVS